MLDQIVNAAGGSWFGPLAITGQLLVILIVVGIAYLLYKNKRIKQRQYEPEFEDEGPARSLQEMIAEQKAEGPDKAIDVELAGKSYNVDGGLDFEQTFRLRGKGAKRTRIAAKGKEPAIRVTNAKQCSIEGVHIEGSIRCNNGELLVENCHIDANEEGVCIEAFDGSVVTFSGTISSEGGIAVHARGESKVILKPPYNVSPDDYVVVDPKSKLHLEKQKAEMPDGLR